MESLSRGGDADNSTDCSADSNVKNQIKVPMFLSAKCCGCRFCTNPSRLGCEVVAKAERMAEKTWYKPLSGARRLRLAV